VSKCPSLSIGATIPDDLRAIAIAPNNDALFCTGINSTLKTKECGSGFGAHDGRSSTRDAPSEKHATSKECEDNRQRSAGRAMQRECDQHGSE
jgi:hypothetical protein